MRKNAAGLSAARIHEMALREVRGMIHHQLARLRSALFDPMSNEDGAEHTSGVGWFFGFGRCMTWM